MGKKKIGIIGLGRLGRKHAENIHYHIQNAELAAICSAMEANFGMNLQVGYNRRFDKSVQAANQKLDEGYIGTPIQVRMVNRDPATMAEFISSSAPPQAALSWTC